MASPVEKCTACGQFIVPKIRFGWVSQLVYDHLSASPHPVPLKQLVNIVYGNHPRGGDDAASARLRTLISNMNCSLVRHGLRIAGRLSGHGEGYRLVELDTVAAEQVMNVSDAWGCPMQSV